MITLTSEIDFIQKTERDVQNNRKHKFWQNIWLPYISIWLFLWVLSVYKGKYSEPVLLLSVYHLKWKQCNKLPLWLNRIVHGLKFFNFFFLLWMKINQPVMNRLCLYDLAAYVDTPRSQGSRPWPCSRRPHSPPSYHHTGRTWPLLRGPWAHEDTDRSRCPIALGWHLLTRLRPW